jgi:hypothetical protein
MTEREIWPIIGFLIGVYTQLYFDWIGKIKKRLGNRTQRRKPC